jgi:hypothetical protein
LTGGVFEVWRGIASGGLSLMEVERAGLEAGLSGGLNQAWWRAAGGD